MPDPWLDSRPASYVALRAPSDGAEVRWRGEVFDSIFQRRTPELTPDLVELAIELVGPDSLPGRYPWGGGEGRFNSPVNINSDLCNHAAPLGRADTVCSRPAGRSWFGLYNQAGNVYEWTADWYDADAYSSAPRTDPFTGAGAIFRQLRGGGWFGPPFSVRNAYRCNFRPRDSDADVGFRPVSRVP